MLVSIGMLKCRLMLHLTFVLMLKGLLVLMMMLIVMLSWVSGDGDWHFFGLSISYQHALEPCQKRRRGRHRMRQQARPRWRITEVRGNSLQQALQRHCLG